MPDEQKEHKADDNVVPLVSPETEQKLNAEEEEFRKLRRDLPGVKGTAAAGMISIAVSKLPGRNVFFRTHPHPDFQPVLSVVTDVAGLEKVFYVVTPEMVMPLATIGILCRDHRMYFCQTADGKLVVVPVICPDEGGNRNSYDATREMGLREGTGRWVRLWTDLPNQCYRVYPSPVDEKGLADVAARYPDTVVWPELPYYKVYMLAYKAKGLWIDSVDHPMFLQWSARDKGTR